MKRSCGYQRDRRNRGGRPCNTTSPQIRVEFPYIDAMTIFDREQLIKIGGYDNELYKLGWFAWELSTERPLSLSPS
jgi:hypothetical protein